jgi:hypothetical protein
MLPRPDRNDEIALDFTGRTTHYWMRFFAALRMTTAWEFAMFLTAAYCVRPASQRRQYAGGMPTFLTIARYRSSP